jgi:hypothetical protein
MTRAGVHQALEHDGDGGAVAQQFFPIDKVEVWGSSPQGPTIFFNGLASTTSAHKAPNGSIIRMRCADVRARQISHNQTSGQRQSLRSRVASAAP